MGNRGIARHSERVHASSVCDSLGDEVRREFSNDGIDHARMTMLQKQSSQRPFSSCL